MSSKRYDGKICVMQHVKIRSCRSGKIFGIQAPTVLYYGLSVAKAVRGDSEKKEQFLAVCLYFSLLNPCLNQQQGTSS